ncbi:MAG: AtpZ/AtpI family protein [Megasphaera sp.]|jgi:ATP synthase protein I|nr:AtpZ/AtpI family protein [Megasphaera sp.]MCH4187469.1 AtpZ/AtpI family protein [Megasphaera sp.]MCH4217388.1 AtpZ/AtpI family protein [Megasphaera sp.]
MKKEKQSLLDMIVVAGSMGMTLFVCICAGVFAGRFLDNLAGTTPWGIMLGGLIGAVTGFWTLYKKALAYMKDVPPDHHDGSGK